MINDEKYNIVETHYPNQFYAQVLQKENDKWVTTNNFKHITINDNEMKLQDVQQTTWDNIENNWLSNSNFFNLSNLGVIESTVIDGDHNKKTNTQHQQTQDQIHQMQRQGKAKPFLVKKKKKIKC